MSASNRRTAISVLVVSTLAFTVCFMVWMMFGVIGIPLKKQLGLSATQFGLLTATPVLTGSLVRVPLGIWTDRFGGRIVLFITMLLCVVPIWLMSYATEYWHFLVLGLFVGLAGGSFSVGTPYVARWFPKQQQGFAMGVFGAGAALAALAGVIGGVAFVTEPGMAATVGSVLFVVVVVGGLGSLAGAFWASLFIGTLQTLAVGIDLPLGELLGRQGVAEHPLWRLTVSQLAPVLPYALLVLVLIVRPNGWLGRSEDRA